MDTHRLRYFLRIADEGSMSRAASVLGIAQPALSRQVRLLEADLGVTLFHRTSRGVTLTPEGEQLRATTSAPLRQLELAMQWVGSPWASVQRGLVLGLPAPIAAVLAAPLLAALTTAFPDVNVRVAVTDSMRLVERMRNGEIDFAVIHGPPPDERVFYREILVERPVLVGGPASDLDPGRPVGFAALADLPLVLPTLQSDLVYTIQNTALRQQITIESRFETDSLQVSKSLIEAGLAYGILPLSACGHEVATGRLRHAPLCDPVLTQHVGLAIGPQLEVPRAFVVEFGRIVRGEAARLVQSGAWPAELLATHDWVDEPHTRVEVARPPRGSIPTRAYGSSD